MSSTPARQRRPRQPRAPRRAAAAAAGRQRRQRGRWTSRAWTCGWARSPKSGGIQTQTGESTRERFAEECAEDSRAQARQLTCSVYTCGPARRLHELHNSPSFCESPISACAVRFAYFSVGWAPMLLLPAACTWRRWTSGRRRRGKWCLGSSSSSQRRAPGTCTRPAAASPHTADVELPASLTALVQTSIQLSRVAVSASWFRAPFPDTAAVHGDTCCRRA